MSKVRKALYAAGVWIGTVLLVTTGANEQEALEILHGREKE
ncbi:hypothetical protein [Christensenella massiliensis]|uniref:Uncharacterized protein n=1 Tax=Christensenella massiliensis TaxID=1805714 RepID=A0AAU8AC72_9FIRM